VRFWDASAIVPLLVEEPASVRLRTLAREDPELLVWWGTPVEVYSALARREREGDLGRLAFTRTVAGLRALEASWNEVVASEAVRRAALRLLRLHALRSADALQLAAAVVAAEHDPTSLELVCLDERLGEAASREGFTVLPEGGA